MDTIFFGVHCDQQITAVELVYKHKIKKNKKRNILNWFLDLHPHQTLAIFAFVTSMCQNASAIWSTDSTGLCSILFYSILLSPLKKSMTKRKTNLFLYCALWQKCFWLQYLKWPQDKKLTHQRNASVRQQPGKNTQNESSQWDSETNILFHKYNPKVKGLTQASAHTYQTDPAVRQMSLRRINIKMKQKQKWSCIAPDKFLQLTLGWKYGIRKLNVKISK